MFRIPELKRRLLFTGMILLVYRLGGHITTPGIDLDAIRQFFEGQQGTLVGLYDLFAGGNLSNATIFGLGIMPYISASIIFQLLQAVIPYFEKLRKRATRDARRSINTRVTEPWDWPWCSPSVSVSPWKAWAWFSTPAWPSSW
jgi:preprotein translocase subunit SecY